MMNKEEQQLQIDRYLLDEMGLQEKTDFENRLQEDEALAETFKHQRAIFLASQQEGRDQLKKELQSWDNEQDMEREPDIKMFSSRWKIAATIAVLAISSIIYFLAVRQTPDSLYDQYFEPLPNAMVRIERGERDTTDMKKEAMIHYEEGAYENAATTLEKILTKTPDAEVQLYLGISLMALEEYTRAAETMESMSKSDNADYEEARQWYLSLCYIKLKRPDAARNSLQTVIEMNRSHRDKALDLVDAL